MKTLFTGAVSAIIVLFSMSQVNSLPSKTKKGDLWKKDEAFISSCVAKTQHALQYSGADQKLRIVCEAKQLFGDCIAEPRDGGPLLEFLRYYRWQENEADVKLNICPNLKVDKLKELMKDSDLAKKLNPKDDVENDDYSKCAAAIFKDCINYVPQPMENVVKAMSSFLECVEGKSRTCPSKLIQHFTNLAKQIHGLLKKEEGALEKES